MPRLVMKRGPTLGTIYELQDAEYTIGRGSKNGVIIRDNEVSREHCRLVRVGDDYEVYDLDSSNGTFVNGQRVIGGRMLAHGGIIELGDSITLEYERLPYPGATMPLLFPEETADAPPPELADRATDQLAPPRRCTLTMTIGPLPNHVYELEAPLITVGRELNNDIVVQDPEVSRYHLRLRRMKNGYGVEDLGSTNGTVLNHSTLQPGSPRGLDDGDVLTLGASVSLAYRAHVLAGEHGLAETQPAERAAAPTNREDTLHSALIRGVRSSPVRTSRLGTGLVPGALSEHIFIAYAREDWELLIAPLTMGLEDAGAPVWVDQYLTRGSDDWRAAFEQALIEARMMVVVLTMASSADPTVKVAYRHYAKRGRPILLLVTDTRCTLPPELETARLLPFEAENPRRTLHRVLVEVME
jgi:pSer/pThr/pTyr-binding forkhead associated (FHA) protein